MWILLVLVVVAVVIGLFALSFAPQAADTTSAVGRTAAAAAVSAVAAADRRAGQAAAAAQAALNARLYTAAPLRPLLTSVRCTEGVSELAADGTRCQVLCQPGETVSADGERCIRPCPEGPAVAPYDDARCVSGAAAFDIPTTLTTYQDTDGSRQYLIAPDAAAAAAAGWVREGEQFCRALLPTGQYAQSNVCAAPGAQQYSAAELAGTGTQSVARTAPAVFAQEYTFPRQSYRR